MRVSRPRSGPTGNQPMPRRSTIAYAVWLATGGAVLGMATPQDALAQTATQQAPAARQSYDIPAGPLAPALRSLAGTANVLLTFTAEQTSGRTTPGIRGQYTLEEALSALLAESGLQAFRLSSGGYVLRAVPVLPTSGNAASEEDKTLPVVKVTASAEQYPNELPPAYAGGRIARGSRVGLLGNKDVMDTPFNTASYTAEMIEDQQAHTVSEVLRADSSVREIFPESGPAEHFNIRGFYMQSSDFAWNGLFGLVPHNRGATELLERVEVLKGPGALLYGMTLGGAVGGVVNLVPKRAADEPLTRLTTSFASDSSLGAHVDIGRRFGDNKEFGIRVNGAKLAGDTAIDGQSQNRGLGSIALDYRGERLRATLDAYNIVDKQSGGATLLTTFASSRIPSAPDPTINALPGAYSTSRSKALIGSVEFDFNEQWTGFAAIGAKRQTGAGYLNNALGTNAQASGAYTAAAMNVKNFFDTNSAETGIRGRLRTGSVGHAITVSANVIEETSGTVASRAAWASNIYAPTTPTLATEPGSAPKTSETTLSGVALADTLSFSEGKYLLTLGVRQQRVRTTSYATSGSTTARYDKQAVTPAVGFVVKPWAAPISVYTNYIEGLSQGSTVSDTTAPNYGEVFAPYKSKQIEVGLKWDAGSFLNTLSVFQITRPSLIQDTVTKIYGVDGEQRNRGIEWSTAGEIMTGLRLLGGVTHIKAETTKTYGGLLDGKTAIGVPAWQFNLGSEWDTPWVPGLTLGATAIHTGKQYANTANTQELPSWTRVDLTTRYATKLAGRDVVFRGGVVNAFDKRYWSGVWNGYVSVGAPRTFQVSASVDF